jgi:hypothetical protein
MDGPVEAPEINFAQLIVIGKIMGYPEKDIWRMTLAKLFALWKEYKILLGFEKRTPEEVIPEDVI